MLLALLLAPAPLMRTVSLSLGASIPDGSGGQYLYESVVDTYLDHEQADRNAGGEFRLMGGRGQTILIRFGDLERALGEYHHVRKATLFLAPDSPEKPQFANIARVQVPWGEGPLLVVGKPFVKPTIPGALPAPVMSATWKDRRAGTPWTEAGARGDADATFIPDTKEAQAGDDIAIEGLASAVQQMADHPTENFGFAINFSNSCSFVSSQDRTGRPRLELEIEKQPQPDVAMADLSVTRVDISPTYDVAANKLPAKGEMMTYTAHIRNEGAAKCPGFIARWINNERPGSSIEIDKPLAHGEETTATIQIPFEPGDHRGGTVGFTVTAKGPDQNPRNNALSIHPRGKAVGLVVGQSFQEAIQKEGYGSVEDWAQECLRRLNETYLPHSRFSFAADGILERFRLQSAAVVADSELANQRSGEDLDAVLTFSQADAAKPLGELDNLFVKRLGFAMGLSDLGAMSASYQIPNGSLRSSEDRFGGVMGGGDTRFDGGLPGFFVLPYEPYSNPLFDSVVAEPTGLFSATDAFALNSGLDTRGKVKPALLDQPSLVLIKAVAMDGAPLTGAELSFFQTKAGKIDDSAPAFTVVTDASGVASLPNRTGGAKPSPFGNLAADGSNGLLVVRSSANGTSDIGWLKAWQLADAFHRTGRPAPEFELRFNLPSQPLDLTANLADGRPVRDSANDLPAKLTALVDGNADSQVQLPKEAEGWVEVDLGRDRFIGEIQLATKDPAFWQKFDIVAYATGQDIAQATPWMKELDWDWSVEARGDKDASGATMMHYRGAAGRFRYIRIVNRGGAAKSASLADIRVFGVKG